jgi:hypothetical protein
MTAITGTGDSVSSTRASHESQVNIEKKHKKLRCHPISPLFDQRQLLGKINRDPTTRALLSLPTNRCWFAAAAKGDGRSIYVLLIILDT